MGSDSLMPLYVAQCACGHVADYYQTIEGRDDAPTHCGQPVQRIITAPSMVIGDIQPYRSMVDGTMVMGRAEHREHLKKHNVIEVGDQQHTLKPYGQYRSPPGLKQAVIDSYHKVKEQQRRR